MIRRATLRISLLSICTVASGVALAGTARAAPTPEQCRSSARPSGDRVAFMKACRDLFAAGRAAAGAGTLAADPPSVIDSRVPPSQVNFANVPTWSDADILAQFQAMRDARYLVDWWDTANPEFPRRIPWLFLDVGCQHRAEAMAIRAAEAGKARPLKLFAFGDLRVFTDNHPSGVVRWNYHVAPIVKNQAGEPIVIDPSVNPCRPLPWREWLALMVNDMSEYDHPENWAGVVLASTWAYDDFSLLQGDPEDSVKAIPAMQGEYLEYERVTQEALGRSVYDVLGSNPPWAGYKCVQVEQRTASTTIAPGATATLNAVCPFGTKVVGSGWFLGSSQQNVSKTAKSGNGWQVVSRNNGSLTVGLEVQANCLVGAPANASVTTVTGSTVNVTANNFATATANCPSGSLVGGGYSTTAGSTVMRIYANRRSTTSPSSWVVSAQNTTTSTRSVTPYAYCLGGTNFSYSQTSASLGSGRSRASATCAATQSLMGGGFSFPRTTAYAIPYTSSFLGTAYVTEFVPSPAAGDPNALSYAQCLSHP